MLTEREIAAVLSEMSRTRDGAFARGARKLMEMYAKVLDHEGYLEAGYIEAWLKQSNNGDQIR
jgi:hypothetical protein